MVLDVIDSPGCQSPVTGMYHGVGALIASPVGKTRSELQVFHANAHTGFDDWASVGTLWKGQAGYSSLLATKSLAPKSNGHDGGQPVVGGEYMVLFEEGQATGPMYQYISLITFSLT
jgi:hypothetical protein